MIGAARAGAKHYGEAETQIQTSGQVMTEADAVRIMRAHLESQFPKVCDHCQRRYATLREYLGATKPLGDTMPWDAELGDWQPTEPVGTVTLANCACGNTLALSSEGMPLPQYAALLGWAWMETKRRGVTPVRLFNFLRDEITAQVLASRE